jgi:hypothetical protein
MSLTVVVDNTDIDNTRTSADGKPSKLKRCVVRNLGRIEQIFACAERLMERHDDVDHSVQAETKTA